MQELRIKRLLIIGIIGIIYSLFLIGDYFYKTNSITEVIVACSLFLASVVFIIASIDLKKINKKKKKVSK